MRIFVLLGDVPNIVLMHPYLARTRVACIAPQNNNNSKQFSNKSLKSFAKSSSFGAVMFTAVFYKQENYTCFLTRIIPCLHLNKRLYQRTIYCNMFVLVLSENCAFIRALHCLHKLQCSRTKKKLNWEFILWAWYWHP